MSRYRGKKKYTPVWPYMASIVMLVVLTFFFWFELCKALEHSMIELPQTTVSMGVKS